MNCFTYLIYHKIKKCETIIIRNIKKVSYLYYDRYNNKKYNLHTCS